MLKRVIFNEVQMPVIVEQAASFFEKLICLARSSTLPLVDIIREGYYYFYLHSWAKF